MRMRSVFSQYCCKSPAILSGSNLILPHPLKYWVHLWNSELKIVWGLKYSVLGETRDGIIGIMKAQYLPFEPAYILPNYGCEQEEASAGGQGSKSTLRAHCVLRKSPLLLIHLGCVSDTVLDVNVCVLLHEQGNSFFKLF